MPDRDLLISISSFGDDSVPILATAIHNGHFMPAELLANCGVSEADRLREEDPHTGEMAALFPNHIILQTSRFAIDLNRPLEKAVYLEPADCWGLPVRARPLADDLLASLREDYASWYKLLRYHVERLLARHPFLVVLDLHSYNHRRGGPLAEPDPQDANPDIIIGSWCGKKFRPEKVAARVGWEKVNAVKYQQLFEIKSADILQPGPAALTDGVAQLHRIVTEWSRMHG